MVDKIIIPAIEFLKDAHGKVAVVFGHDADSITSAAIIYKLLQKLHAKPVLVVAEENFTITTKTVTRLKRMKPFQIICLDIADISVQTMNGLSEIAQVLNIDHHIPKGYDNIIYVNPRLHDKHAYIPVSYLCYRIYRKFFSDGVMWIAGIGTLGDHGVTNCLDLFHDIKRIYPELVGDVKLVDENLFSDSLLGKLTKMIDAGRVIVGAKGSMKTAELLVHAKNYNDILNSNQLKIWNKKAEKEFDRIVSDFWRSKKHLGDVVFYEIKSKYNFKSPLAGYLQQSFEDKIIVIGQKDGRMLDVSLRRGTKVTSDLSEIALNIAADVPGSTGGGHESASAVRVPLNKKGELLEVLFKQKKA